MNPSRPRRAPTPSSALPPAHAVAVIGAAASKSSESAIPMSAAAAPTFLHVRAATVDQGAVRKAITVLRAIGALLDWVEWPEPGMITRWPRGACAASC